jgi:hypothetical protein
MPREIEKRKNAYQANLDERNKLNRMYDESLARRVPNSVAAKAADNMDKVDGGLYSLILSTTSLWTRRS